MTEYEISFNKHGDLWPWWIGSASLGAAGGFVGGGYSEWLVGALVLLSILVHVRTKKVKQ